MDYILSRISRSPCFMSDDEVIQRLTYRHHQDWRSTGEEPRGVHQVAHSHQGAGAVLEGVVPGVDAVVGVGATVTRGE